MCKNLISSVGDIDAEEIWKQCKFLVPLKAQPICRKSIVDYSIAIVIISVLYCHYESQLELVKTVHVGLQDENNKKKFKRVYYSTIKTSTTSEMHDYQNSSHFCHQQEGFTYENNAYFPELSAPTPAAPYPTP